MALSTAFLLLFDLKLAAPPSSSKMPQGIVTAVLISDVPSVFDTLSVSEKGKKNYVVPLLIAPCPTTCNYREPMPAHTGNSEIFASFFQGNEIQKVFSDKQMVIYWLKVEAALAKVQANLNLIPLNAAAEIADKAKVENIDFPRLAEATADVGYPILPLVRQLASACEKDYGEYVHWGATTQDIMDTADVLQLRDGLQIIKQQHIQLIGVLTDIAIMHRDTVMAGRTHGQQALPITLGFKLAVWISELRRHLDRLDDMELRLYQCQFGGAVGTLASLGTRGWDVHQALAKEIDLKPANIAWHTARDSFTEVVCVLAMSTATLGKIANEIATLQKSETAELAEPFWEGKGSSSTMPQKRNPILCEAVIGISKKVTLLPSAMLMAMMPEHERATGEWHTEWNVIPEACVLASVCYQHILAILTDLAVDQENMRKNLRVTEGQIVAEAVMMRLAERIGRQKAHDVVYQACLIAQKKKRHLKQVMMEDSTITSAISAEDIDKLLTPENYTGLASFFVDLVTKEELR